MSGSYPTEPFHLISRLDCLRRISKGTVDFSALSPEDLVAAQWATQWGDVDVLVTNELRQKSSTSEFIYHYLFHSKTIIGISQLRNYWLSGRNGKMPGHNTTDRFLSWQGICSWTGLVNLTQRGAILAHILPVFTSFEWRQRAILQDFARALIVTPLLFPMLSLNIFLTPLGRRYNEDLGFRTEMASLFQILDRSPVDRFVKTHLIIPLLCQSDNY